MAAYFPNNGLYHYVIVRDEIIDRFTNYLDNVDMELKWRYWHSIIELFNSRSQYIRERSHLV